MSPRPPSEAELYCHPDTPCLAVVDIKAAISWERGRALKIVYTLHGVVERLRIPPRRAVRRTDDLWQRTCFELFVGAQNDREYYEFNFSPSGEWAAYGFRDYRDRVSLDSNELDPSIDVQQAAAAMELCAIVHVDRLQGIAPKLRLSLGLCAVIEDLDGSLSYWALKHPPGKPDFHHADAFALELIVPGQ